MVCVPLAGSQRCSARVHNILFNLLTIKQQRVSLLVFPFFSQTLVTLDKSLFSFGLSNRRISAVFSCFDQSLILPVRPYKEARLYYFYLSLYRIQFKTFRESHELSITDCSSFSSPLAAVILFKPQF